MSATPPRRCANIPSAGSRCKDTIKFSDVQILSAKSVRSFKGNEADLRFSTRAERGVRKKEIGNL